MLGRLSYITDVTFMHVYICFVMCSGRMLADAYRGYSLAESVATWYDIVRMDFDLLNLIKAET